MRVMYGHHGIRRISDRVIVKTEGKVILCVFCLSGRGGVVKYIYTVHMAAVDGCECGRAYGEAAAVIHHPAHPQVIIAIHS